MSQQTENKCPVCHNRGIIRPNCSMEIDNKIFTIDNKIFTYEQICPVCSDKDKEHQPLFPKKDLVYECDGSHGNGEIYHYWYKNTDPLTASWPLYHECFEVKVKIEGISFILEFNPISNENFEKTKEKVKALVNENFKYIKIYPYLGMLTLDVEYRE